MEGIDVLLIIIDDFVMNDGVFVIFDQEICEFI